jgi:hypothetical protein
MKRFLLEMQVFLQFIIPFVIIPNPADIVNGNKGTDTGEWVKTST